jgi:hypothetical protein
MCSLRLIADPAHDARFDCISVVSQSFVHSALCRFPALGRFGGASHGSHPCLSPCGRFSRGHDVVRVACADGSGTVATALQNEGVATEPRVFMSYSHDDDEHRDWVLQLSSRLRGNGVDVCLDRWDVTLAAVNDGRILTPFRRGGF